ncbi:protein phosphatase 1 regulatory subunit 27b [Pholidichthys leucotaenia]
MKCYQSPVTQAIAIKAYTHDIPNNRKSAPSLKSVHFSNDVLFLDYVREGELERIGRFIRAGRIELDTMHVSGMAAIHEAVLSGNLECVKLLVKYGADIHQRDEEGWTPLHMACSDSFPQIARYLLSQGADPELENNCGEKPADLIEPDNKELLQLFGVAVND